MEEVFTRLQKHQEKPTLIIFRTVIGKGAPHKEGTHKVHGSPLGADEISAAKEALGLPQEEFYVPQSVHSFFEQKLAKDAALESSWNEMHRLWALDYPELARDFDKMQTQHLPEDLEKLLQEIKIKSPIAGRSASYEVLQTLGKLLPQLYGGSADLSGSDMTMMKDFPLIASGQFAARNIKYGVREFGMGTIANGLFLTGMITPYCGTFLTFSDYMRNSIRLAALSHYHTIYQFTHDSIFLGEDGPTHQSIEQLASLRAIPNLHVIRPADGHEVKMAWIAALRYKGPSAIVLSRQNLPELACTDVRYADGMARGGYIVKKESVAPIDFTLFSTGSELALTLDAAARLEKLSKNVRVVSMPCWALFDKQPENYKEAIIGGDLGVRVAIEAGSDFGWQKYIGIYGIAICMERFGESAPAPELAHYFGFTVDAIVERLIAHEKKQSSI